MRRHFMPGMRVKVKPLPGNEDWAGQEGVVESTYENPVHNIYDVYVHLDGDKLPDPCLFDDHELEIIGEEV